MSAFPSPPQAYWRGDPVPSRRVRVRLPDAIPPAFWCAGLAGRERDGLEISAPEGAVLIDDEGGVGIAVVSSFMHFGGYRLLPPGTVIVDELGER